MDTKYSVTFARRGLLYQESVKLATIYSERCNWSAVRQHALDSNILQTRTLSTSKKLCSEIVSRLKTLTEDELMLLRFVSKEEQRYLLWLAVCKKYRFIHEFAVEVLHEKFLQHSLFVSVADYDRFFNNKAEWHEELSNLSMETQKKVQQTVFLLMREAQLINKQNEILPALFSGEFLKCVSRESHDYMIVFPLSIAEGMRAG